MIDPDRTMNPPEVDRLAGSRAAVAARRARAEVKRQVSNGERSASEVLSTAARDQTPSPRRPCGSAS